MTVNQFSSAFLVAGWRFGRADNSCHNVVMRQESVKSGAAVFIGGGIVRQYSLAPQIWHMFCLVAGHRSADFSAVIPLNVHIFRRAMTA